MLKRELSIRDILLLTVGILTLLIASMASNAMYKEWHKLQDIRSLKEAAILSDQLFDAGEKLSVERDVAYSMLHAPNSEIITLLRPRLLSSRKEADYVLGLALRSLKSYDLPELPIQLKKTETQFDNLHKLRQKIDDAISLPMEKRDIALSQHWFVDATSMILQTQDLWMGFIKNYTNIDPSAILHMRFKYFLGIIMEYSGRERSLIGRLIVDNADPTSSEQAELLKWQSVVDFGWSISDMFASQGRLYPAITPYFKDAKSHYYTIYDMVHGMFYVPGSHHVGQYPISVDFWLDLATQATDSLYALKDAVLKETQSYIDSLEAQTIRTIEINSILLLLALFLCFYSFRVIIGRVIFPINYMIKALINATEGKATSFIPPSIGQRDEIGKLAGVLQAFQKNMEQIKQTSAELEKSESKLRLMFDHALDAVITIDADGIITEWNKQAEVIFDCTSQYAVGKKLADLIIPPEYREAHYKGMQQFLKDATGPILNKRIEVFAINRHGRNFPVELSVTANKILDRYYFTAFVRDITERKKAEHELKRYTDSLERSNKELDDFSYIASHDLKEPLRGIHNHSRFLLEDNEDKLDPDSISRLGRLIYLSQRMEMLVNDLLYFSRLGRQDLAIQRADINEIIHDVKNTLDVFIAEHNANVVIPRILPVLVCDKVRVTELFRNLITNAVKYNDSKEKTVEIGFKEIHYSSGGMIIRNVFYVKDNGRGIAPEFYEEIFRIFKRLQSNKGQKESGTGVGLTFVKKIVERHGGKIWLTSELGKGTTFYFTFGENEDDKKNAA